MSVKKYQIAPFINTAIDSDTGLVDKENPVWTRIKKTTAFDLNMNPQTEERDYIADENPTVDLLRYVPSFSTPLVMHKGEDDYDFIFSKFANQKVGEEAKAELCLVFFQEPCDEPEEGEEHVVFLAWKADCTLTINDLNSVDETITFDVAFNDEPEIGYVTVDDGDIEFTEGTYSAS